MKPLLPSQELSLKKLLLEVRKAHPSVPAIAVAEETFFDNDAEMQTDYVQLTLPGTSFYCRVFSDAVRADPMGQNGEGYVSTMDWGSRLQVVADWASMAITERSALLELRKLDAEFTAEGVNAYAEAAEGEMFSDAERAALDTDLMAFAQQVGVRFDSLKAQVGGVGEKLDQILEQQAKVMNSVERLRVSSERLGKKDWSLMALGTVASVFTSAAVPPEMAQALARDFFAQLAHIKLLPP